MSNVTKYKIGIESRISTLEANYRGLRESIDEIKDNHLAHLEAKIDKMFWFLLTTAVGVLVNVLVNLIK